ncbi:MAG: flagellar protein FliS [bacterium]
MNTSRVSTPTNQRLERDDPQGPSRNELVPNLYAALAAALQTMERAMVERNATDKANALVAANAVVFELIASIDFERGGELAPRLTALYSYFSSELLHIGRTGDRQPIGALMDMIGLLTERWEDSATPGGSTA